MVFPYLAAEDDNRVCASVCHMTSSPKQEDWYDAYKRDSDTNLITGDFAFTPFPPEEAELGNALSTLLQEIKISLGEGVWGQVEKNLPVNIRRLFRETYGL